VADIPREIADLHILVDDASPDNTAALARELGIDVYVHSETRDELPLGIAVAAEWADPATWYNALRSPAASTCER
jgi:hypothetical protein